MKLMKNLIENKRGDIGDYFKDEAEKSLYKELKKMYKKVFRCITCRNIYGSDNKRDNKICPRCSYKHSENLEGSENSKKLKGFKKKRKKVFGS